MNTVHGVLLKLVVFNVHLKHNIHTQFSLITFKQYNITKPRTFSFKSRLNCKFNILAIFDTVLVEYCPI